MRWPTPLLAGLNSRHTASCVWLTHGGQQETRNGQQRALCAALDEFEVAVEDVGKEAVADARHSKRFGALLCARVPAAKKIDGFQIRLGFFGFCVLGRQKVDFVGAAESGFC